MAKTDAFRVCIAILLMIQLTCWAFTLLDLLSPGRPIVLLLYKDFRSRMF
jgi:hypothetical protein